MLAEAALVLSLTPHVCSEPCKVQISIRAAEPAKVVCIALESEGWYREACWPGRGKKFHSTAIRDIPAGEYVVVAVVVGQDPVDLCQGSKCPSHEKRQRTILVVLGE